MSDHGSISIENYGHNYVVFRFSRNVSVNRLYRNRKGQIKPYFIHSKIYFYLLEDNRNIIDYNFLQCDCYRFRYIMITHNNRKRDLSNHIKFFEDVVFRLMIKDDDSKVGDIFMTRIVLPNKYKANYMYIHWECRPVQDELEKYSSELSNVILSIRDEVNPSASVSPENSP